MHAHGDRSADRLVRNRTRLQRRRRFIGVHVAAQFVGTEATGVVGQVPQVAVRAGRHRVARARQLIEHGLIEHSRTRGVEPHCAQLVDVVAGEKPDVLEDRRVVLARVEAATSRRGRRLVVGQRIDQRGIRNRLLAFHDGPTVVATRQDVVDLVHPATTVFGLVEVTRNRVDRQTELVAMAHRVDHVARRRVVTRNGEVGHLKAQDLAAPIRRVLRVRRAEGVAGPDVERAILTEDHGARVVVELRGNRSARRHHREASALTVDVLQARNLVLRATWRGEEHVDVPVARK